MLAVLQARSVTGDKQANLRKLDAAVESAARAGCKLLVLPELFLTGYNLGAQLIDLAEPCEGPSLLVVREIAARHRMALVVGFPERSGEKIYNSSAVVDATGLVQTVYRKIHLYGETERSIFTPGNEVKHVDLGDFRLGLAICYDVEFPEVARALARGGANVIVAPTCNMVPFWEIPTTIIRARALENSLCVAYANHCGQEGDLRYTGLSCVVGPDGKDLARAAIGDEELIVADVTSALAAPSNYSQISDLRGDLFR